MNEEEEVEASRHHPAYLWRAHQVKDYVEAMLEEKDRALQLVADERDRAAETLQAEQHRQLDTAEHEREKAAAALRDQLTERIAAGDTNLREHILAQVSQLRLMVENSETLAITRHDAMQREAKIQHEADQSAIKKAEAANETRFAAANEWRGQSADRERTQQEQIASFVATLTPLSKAEAIEDKLAAAIDRNRSDIETLTKRFDVKQGEATGMKITTSFIVTMVTVAISVIGIIIVLANYFTTH